MSFFKSQFKYRNKAPWNGLFYSAVEFRGIFSSNRRWSVLSTSKAAVMSCCWLYSSSEFKFKLISCPPQLPQTPNPSQHSLLWHLCCHLVQHSRPVPMILRLDNNTTNLYMWMQWIWTDSCNKCSRQCIKHNNNSVQHLINSLHLTPPRKSCTILHCLTPKIYTSHCVKLINVILTVLFAARICFQVLWTSNHHGKLLNRRNRKDPTLKLCVRSSVAMFSMNHACFRGWKDRTNARCADSNLKRTMPNSMSAFVNETLDGVADPIQTWSIHPSINPSIHNMNKIATVEIYLCVDLIEIISVLRDKYYVEIISAWV